MNLHHDKHFAAYTKKLNAALVSAGLADVVTDEAALCKLLANVGAAGGRGGTAIADPALRAAIRNNGGGYVNHQLFFASMTAPGTSPKPSVVLCEAVDGGFGSFDKMRSAFTAAATGLFGSGWVWLAVDTAAATAWSSRRPPIRMCRTRPRRASCPSSASTCGSTPTMSSPKPAPGIRRGVVVGRRLARRGEAVQ
eukprot:TRINITY_DN2584_c0_g1_i1.p1 TRINITY_DN2584_c0_g1~~TRINITY_DN2584_c0_g1_i1.p1  ORF type:complete len:222 (-),score=72.96 TRINITY_DN2584_c0_g1_i1:220-804(-)